MAGDHRAFRAFTGVHPMVAEKIFMKYYHWFYLPDRSKLLMVLHYLKDMPSEDNACFTFKLGSRNTYRKWLWRVLYYLDHVMTEVCNHTQFLKPPWESLPLNFLAPKVHTNLRLDFL